MVDLWRRSDLTGNFFLSICFSNSEWKKLVANVDKTPVTQEPSRLIVVFFVEPLGNKVVYFRHFSKIQTLHEKFKGGIASDYFYAKPQILYFHAFVELAIKVIKSCEWSCKTTRLLSIWSCLFSVLFVEAMNFIWWW